MWALLLAGASNAAAGADIGVAADGTQGFPAADDRARARAGLPTGWGPQRGEDGVLAVTYPMGDKKLPGIASEDIGKCACGIFKAGDEFIGKTIGVAGEHLTGAEIAAPLTKALGEEPRYNAVPADVYRSFGFSGADDVGNTFQFKREFNADYCGARSLEVSRRLNPELQTVDGWLAVNKDRIPVPVG